MHKGLAILGLAGAVAVFCAFIPQAHAQSGLYLGAYGGLNDARDSDVDFDDSPGVTGRGEFDRGFVAGGVIGMAVPVGRAGAVHAPLGLRTEIDINYRQNDVDALHAELGGIGEGSTTDVDGRIKAWAALANAWLDVNLGFLTPYAGGGVGAARVELDDVQVMGETAANDRDTVFAWQLGAGSAINLTEFMALTVDYRYFVANNPTFTDEAGGDFEMEYENHSVMAGLRIAF